MFVRVKMHRKNIVQFQGALAILKLAIQLHKVVNSAIIKNSQASIEPDSVDFGEYKKLPTFLKINQNNQHAVCRFIDVSDFIL